MRRVRQALLTAATTVLLFAMTATGAVAAFNALTSNPGNSFGTAPDFARPAVSTVDPPVIAHSNGKVDYVKAGQTYYVYATLTDAGNPSSGISSVTANLSSLGGSATTTMTAGSYALGAKTYTYRSAIQTVTAGTLEGAKAFSITSGDGAANSGTDSGYSVTVDNTAPAFAAGAAGAVIQKTSGGKAGFVKQGGTYYIYANPTDGGSGVAGVTADVAVAPNANRITTGQTAVPLTTTGGPYNNVDGNTYTHRSAQLTANAAITAGLKNWTLTATDAVTNAATPVTYTVTADIAVPTLTNAVIAKEIGFTPTFLGTTKPYYIYANIADNSSGVASATAIVTNITVGQPIVPLAAGSYSVGGVSYGWRSASPLTSGAMNTLTWTVTATDEAANASAALPGTAVTKDTTAPTTTDVAGVNGAPSTAGTVGQGDFLRFTFGEEVDTGTLITGFGGMAAGSDVTTAPAAPRQVIVKLINNANNDRIEVWDFADQTKQVNLGSVALGANYTTVDKVWGTAGSPSLMFKPSGTPTRMDVKLGAVTTNVTGLVANGANNAMTWTPLTGMTDRAGNAVPVTVRAEAGGNDIDF